MPSSPPANTLLTRLGGALTHDFCPGANRYVYWLKQPLAVLAIAGLAAVALGATAAPQGYAVACGIGLVLVLGVLWPWLGLAGVSAELSFVQRRVREGEPAEALLIVHNRAPWPCWGLTLEGGLPPAAIPDQAPPESAPPNSVPQGQESLASQAGEPPSARPAPALALAVVPGWSRSEFRWEITPPLLGEYPTAAPQIATEFPFGLWKLARPVAVQSRLLVWPAITPLEATPVPKGLSFALGALSEQRAGSAGEIIGVRSFRPGDLLRNVHWAQTARQAQLIVCEREASLAATVELVVDLADDPPELQAALARIAASLTRLFLQHAARLEVRITGTHAPSACWSGLSGERGEQQVNEGLVRSLTHARLESAVRSAAPERAPPPPGPRLARRGRDPQSVVWIIASAARARGWSECDAGRVIAVTSAASGATDEALPHPGRRADSPALVAPLGPQLLPEFRRAWEEACREIWLAG